MQTMGDLIDSLYLDPVHPSGEPGCQSRAHLASKQSFTAGDFMQLLDQDDDDDRTGNFLIGAGVGGLFDLSKRNDQKSSKDQLPTTQKVDTGPSDQGCRKKSTYGPTTAPRASEQTSILDEYLMTLP